MISRKKYDFKQWERTKDGNKLVEKRGRQIIINDLVFYVNEDFRAVEEITGLYVPLNENLQTDNELRDGMKKMNIQEKLEFIEKSLEKMYDKIKKCVVDYKKTHNIEE